MSAARAGWPNPARAPILAGVRRFFSQVSPSKAWHDLRGFLGRRHSHEYGFMGVALALTGLVIFAFWKDSHFEREYRREIVYFQSWRADRSDAEIRAQQAIDLPKEQAAKAAIEKAEAERRASFKRLDDKLTKWGL